MRRDRVVGPLQIVRSLDYRTQGFQHTDVVQLGDAERVKGTDTIEGLRHTRRLVQDEGAGLTD